MASSSSTAHGCAPEILPAQSSGTHKAVWLQGVTVAWLSVETGVALHAAVRSHSPAVAAFGSDSVVELLSALVVAAQWIPGIHLAERTAARFAAGLLALLALVVTGLALGALLFHHTPEVTRSGLAITVAALLFMPVLAALKRREAKRQGNSALAADAAQSATCAWLALITLIGLAANAFLHLSWLDSVAALVAVPFLLREAREAWNGSACHCC